MAKAEKGGFNGSHAELFAAGYTDGVDGINVTDFLSPAAAFQKGLSKAVTLNSVENDALGHATGFRDGYGFALVGNGSTTSPSRASRAGLTWNGLNFRTSRCAARRYRT